MTRIFFLQLLSEASQFKKKKKNYWKNWSSGFKGLGGMGKHHDALALPSGATMETRPL